MQTQILHTIDEMNSDSKRLRTETDYYHYEPEKEKKKKKYKQNNVPKKSLPYKNSHSQK